jgi:hypothetical protein
MRSQRIPLTATLTTTLTLTPHGNRLDLVLTPGAGTAEAGIAVVSEDPHPAGFAPDCDN